MDEQEIKNLVDSMNKQGASSDEIQRAIDFKKSSLVSTPTAKDEQMGFFKSIVVDAIKPFARTLVTLRGGIAGVGTQLGIPGAAEERQKILEGIPGGAGVIRPFGAQAYDELQSGEIGKGQFVTRAGLDVAGAGAQMASWFFSPLKIASKGGFVKNLFNPASLKAVAPFAGLYAGGKSAEALGEGKTGGEALAEGAGAYLGAAIGFNLLNGGGVLLGNFGSKLMRNPIIKAQTEKLADLADVVINAVPKGVREKIGETFSWNSRMYQKEFETAHKKLVNATIDEFTPSVPTGEEAFQGYKQSLNKYITSQYEKKANDFSDVFSSPHVVESYPSTKTAITKAKAEVDTLIKSGLYESGQSLQNYIGRVESLLGSNYSKPQSLKIIDALYSGSDAFIGKSNAEDALIRDISHSLLDDATLSVSQKDPALLNRWNQARTFSQEISTNVNSEFASKLKNAPKINNFVDSLMTSSGPSREEMSAFNKAFNQTEKDDISQSVFNSIMGKVKNANTLEEGAKMIDDTLKNLNQYGDDNIINANHAAQLENLSDLMKTNFKDFMFKAQTGGNEEIGQVTQKKIETALTEDMVKLADEGRYSELGDRISKITGVEEVQAVLNLVGDDKALKSGIGKEVMRGILTKNKNLFVGESGKYDFSGFFNDLNKIGGSNKDEIFNSIFTAEQKSYIDYLFKLREEIGSLENLEGENLLKLAHGVTGLMYTFTGRAVPATYHLSQIMKVSSKNKIPYAQLRNLSEELIDTSKSKDSVKGRIAEFNIKLGDAIKSKTATGGRVGAVVGGEDKGIEGGPTLDSFFKAAESMFGRPLTDEDKAELETLFNEK